MRDQLDIKQKFDYGIFNKIQCGNEYGSEYLIFLYVFCIQDYKRLLYVIERI